MNFSCGKCGWETTHVCNNVPSLWLFVPGPPIPFKRAMRLASPSGRKWTANPAHYTDYKHHVAMHALQKKKAFEQHYGKWNMDGPFQVWLTFSMPNYRRVDDDNLEKAIKDACNRVLWNDDAWKYFLSVEKSCHIAANDNAGVRIGIANHGMKECHESEQQRPAIPRIQNR